MVTLWAHCRQLPRTFVVVHCAQAKASSCAVSSLMPATKPPRRRWSACRRVPTSIPLWICLTRQSLTHHKPMNGARCGRCRRKVWRMVFRRGGKLTKNACKNCGTSLMPAPVVLRGSHPMWEIRCARVQVEPHNKSARGTRPVGVA